MKTHLFSLVQKHAAQVRPSYRQLPFTVIVAGEAADTPEFIDVVHDLVKAIPELRGSKGSAVELIIPADRTFGAANGAAFWLWTQSVKKYCTEVGFLDQYDLVKEAHNEL